MNADKKQAAYEDFLAGMKYPAIAEKYGVSLSTVKSWAKRHWKTAGGATSQNGGATEQKNEKTKVAVGDAKPGAPPGNQNAYKTGEYAAFMDDCLGDEERDFIRRVLPSPLEQLDQEIKLAVVRERMVMKNLAELQAQRAKPITPNESSDLADNVTKIAEQREGKGKSSQLIVDRRLLEKIIATQDALTRIQKELSKMIEKRHKLMKEADDGSMGKDIKVTIVRATKGDGG